jgi:hypothetical protein
MGDIQPKIVNIGQQLWFDMRLPLMSAKMGLAGL